MEERFLIDIDKSYKDHVKEQENAICQNPLKFRAFSNKKRGIVAFEIKWSTMAMNLIHPNQFLTHLLIILQSPTGKSNFIINYLIYFST